MCLPSSDVLNQMVSDVMQECHATQAVHIIHDDKKSLCT
jgi:hypothetical protein